MKTNYIFIGIVLAITLQLTTLDDIYTGIYDYEKEQWVLFKIITPTSYTYDLTMNLTDTQEGYFFYNLGFGRYRNHNITTE